ncbi:MAG TPA: TMEM165/GDT1 family protein [Noviherbaspirillum sp.]|nr:TMEM165/GDT1 family protein [Noviherbaspirillum sp.]
MEAFLLSTGIVALAEMGDKTQLLSLLLAARFRRPLPIILGIFVATLLNHALAGALGALLSDWLGPDVLRWILAISFLAMAVWVMVPDKLDDVDVKPAAAGVFGVTTAAFFLAEMGDKTQIATVALAAKFDAFGAVVIGTTLGMMIANVPAVLLGDRVTRMVSMKVVHGVAAVLFALLGVATLFNVGGMF